MAKSFFICSSSGLVLAAMMVFGASHAAYTQSTKTILLDEKLSLVISVTTIEEELCSEKKAVEYITETFSSLKPAFLSTKLSGIITWKLNLMWGNWYWSNGVNGVFGESEIRIIKNDGTHAFGLSDGHTESGGSQWAAARGTIDTHLMYLSLMVMNLNRLSPNLEEVFNKLPDIDHDVFKKVRNQMIIAASHTEKEILLEYADNSIHDLLIAIAACGLAVQGEQDAKQYLNRELFDRLSMVDYYEASLARLDRD